MLARHQHVEPDAGDDEPDQRVVVLRGQLLEGLGQTGGTDKQESEEGSDRGQGEYYRRVDGETQTDRHRQEEDRQYAQVRRERGPKDGEVAEPPSEFPLTLRELFLSLGLIVFMRARQDLPCPVEQAADDHRRADS